MSAARLSNTLQVAAGRVRCAGCRHDLAPVSDSWKAAAALSEQPAHGLPGPYRTGKGLLLRQFACPGCGALLDTELALPGEPFLEDRIFSH